MKIKNIGNHRLEIDATGRRSIHPASFWGQSYSAYFQGDENGRLIEPEQEQLVLQGLGGWKTPEKYTFLLRRLAGFQL